MSLGWTSTADGGTGRRSILGGGSCATLMAWYGGTSPARAGVLSVLGVLLHVSVYGGSWMNFCTSCTRCSHWEIRYIISSWFRIWQFLVLCLGVA